MTSVDYEGTRKGFDYELVETITEKLSIPVIASGGMGSLDHIKKLSENFKPDAIAMADDSLRETYCR